MTTPNPKTVQECLTAIWDVLHHAESMDYIGEDVSQLEHALQTAWLARKNGGDNELVIAALLHDIGHLIDPNAPQMSGLGVVDHEHIGGQFLLSLGFSERVAALVAGHVQAKRFLCYRKPSYHKKLSAASRGTLNWQGGPMSAKEAAEFESLPDHKAFLALRGWDEMAKDPNAQVDGLDAYYSMLSEHLNQENTRSC